MIKGKGGARQCCNSVTILNRCIVHFLVHVIVFSDQHAKEHYKEKEDLLRVRQF